MAENSLDYKALHHFLSSLGWRDGQRPDPRREAIVWCLPQVHYFTEEGQFSAEDCLGPLLSHYRALLSEMKGKKCIHINITLNSY